jgi:TetR/AcrR family transcriptional repressor of bet genes
MGSYLTMPKIGMEPIQKEKILTATIRCAAREGLEKITLESIALEAKISKGIISYYFKSKHNVFLSA